LVILLTFFCPLIAEAFDFLEPPLEICSFGDIRSVGEIPFRFPKIALTLDKFSVGNYEVSFLPSARSDLRKRVGSFSQVNL